MRLNRVAATIAISACLMSSLPAKAADEPVVFKPAGQWSLDYGDDYCRLARSFSTGDKALAIAFERIQPGPMMRMILVGDGMRIYRSADELGWHFMPGGDERKARFARAVIADGKDYFNLGPVSIEPPQPPAPGAPPTPPAYDRTAEQAAANSLTGVDITSGLTEPVELDTGSLGAPIKALQACADDLAKTWGLDPARMDKGYIPAAPDGGGVGWLPQGTIPFGDFGKLTGGSNQVRLMIDESGKPTSCRIHWATLEQSLNDKICGILMDKAHFAPAKDPNGKAMPGVWIGSPMFLGPPMPAGMRRR